MLFHTPEFALLFVTCFLLYPWLRRGGQNALLIAGNIVFYLASGLLDSTLFAFVLVFNYLLACRLAGRSDWRTVGATWGAANLVMLASNMGAASIFAAIAGLPMQDVQPFDARAFLQWNAIIAGGALVYLAISVLPKRVSIWVAVILNLANLAAFKYVNFLLGNAASFGKLLGYEWHLPHFQELLPLGISFYSFQIIAYHIDLWRGHTRPAKHLGEFVLFIAFFPQLIAGPILRAYEFLPQLENRRAITMGDVKMGALFILWGLVKKVVIADSLSTVVDPMFGDVSQLRGAQAWVAALGFSFQIYFDFSGYSDIAVGLGHAFGFQLPRNFHQPYLSLDPREFWQRWHVTLSRWLRDYLYISLGGNRGSKLFTWRNLMLTMLLGGLWHGAAWTFVVWGGLHGAWLVAHRWWLERSFAQRLRESGGLGYRLLCHVGVSLMLVVTWVFFRAESVGDAVTILSGMLASGGGQPVGWYMPAALVLLAVLHVFEQHIFEDVPRASRWWHRVPAPGRGFVYAATWLLVVVFLREDAPFIYFRF